MKTFYQWLTSKENRTRRSDIVSDLACDAYGDEGFIRNSGGIRKLHAYLIGRGACEGCMSALDLAYEEFKAYRASRVRGGVA